MGRKLGFNSLFLRIRDTRSSSSCSYSSSLWAWPSCKHPKTHSFRAKDQSDIYKMVNSVYFDPTESCFTNSTDSGSFSTTSKDSGDELVVETVIRGLRSDRLFFEPGDTSSILEKAKAGQFPFKESVVMAMESQDPYRDFRVSMEEMVLAHGVKDWECLEELLGWYLRVNGKNTHGLIFRAFADLLVELSSCSSLSTSSSSLQFKEVEVGVKME